MKVLVAAAHAVGMVGGGINTQIRETMRVLPEFGVEVDYFDQWQTYSPDEIQLIHLFGASKSTHDLALRLKEFGIPFVVSTVFFSLHSPLFLQASWRLENLSKRFVGGIWTDYGFIRSICRESHGVLPNTSAEAHLIEKGLGIEPAKIEVVPNGVSEHFMRGDPQLFYDRYGKRDFILNVANIGSVRKNALSLIRALNEIDHPAVIIGKTYDNDYARKCLHEAKKNPNLLIIDALPNDSTLLASAYAASKVFVLPAYFETPGIAAMEAALAGSRVVITRFGGTTDYFGEFVEYVNPHSIKSITAGIRTALAGSADKALRTHIRNHFLWRKVGEKTAMAYRKFMAGN